jgi:Resolvase, N terminal domain
VILVTELTRWGRSMLDLFHTLQDLQAWGVSLVAQTGLQFDLRSAQGKLIASLMAALSEYAEPAVMRSRELDPVQNTARFLTVSNVMSVWRATHNPGPFSQERSRPARTGCAPVSGQTVQSLLRTSPQSLKR